MCTCNSSSCNGTCGSSLIVNKGAPGPAGVGIKTITPTDNSDGSISLKITLTSGFTQSFIIPAGEQGTSIDHVSISTSTLSFIIPPTPGLPGATDTYTVWADLAETVALGTFNVYNGSDGLSDSDFANVGNGSPIYVEDSEYKFRTIVSDHLTVTHTSTEVTVNDPRYPVQIVISTPQDKNVYLLALASYKYYQPVEVTNKTTSVVSVAIPNGISYEECPYSSGDQIVFLLPKATMVVWRSLKNNVTRASVLTYKSKAYSKEVTDFQNNFNYDTDKIYLRTTESRQVSITGRLRFTGSSIDDNGIVFIIESLFRPPRTVYFNGTMSINTSSPSTQISLSNQTSFTVTFSLTPTGVVSIIGVAAPIGASSPTSFAINSDVRFIKSYASTIRFSGVWDGAVGLNTGTNSES